MAVRRRRGGRLRGGAWILVAALAGAWAPALAASRDCPDGVVESLRTSEAFGEWPEFERPVNFVAQACRLWPYDPERLLVAAAYSTGESVVGNRDLHIRVSMLDARSHRFIAGYGRREREDAGFELSGDALALDTARYQLSPTVRAFGLVVRNSARGPSCPDAWWNEELTLLVRDGEALRPVLSTPLWAWERVEGEPCAPQMYGGFADDSARLLVGVEPTSSSGFADLRVIADVERQVEAWSDDGREDSSGSRRRRSVVLRYDGTRYDQGPLQNGFFWSEAEWRTEHGD